jgi:uncharacterized protein (DUF362 family)
VDKVALVKCRKNFKETLKEAWELVGGFNINSPFIIKPNICTGNDQTGCANVKIEVIEGLVDQIIDKKPETSIKIVESDSSSKYADKAFAKFGYTDYVEQKRENGINVELVNLTKSPLSKKKFNGYYFKDPMLPKILSEANGIASVALAKTHELTMVTGALKNLFGFLPMKEQYYYHPHIHEIILDFNIMYRSRLCLIDARVGLEGVLTGNPREMGCIVLGKNPVSVDAVMARIMGFKAERIRHLVEASEFGLGSLHPEVLGNRVEDLTVKFSKHFDLDPKALLN